MASYTSLKHNNVHLNWSLKYFKYFFVCFLQLHINCKKSISKIPKRLFYCDIQDKRRRNTSRKCEGTFGDFDQRNSHRGEWDAIFEYDLQISFTQPWFQPFIEC